MPTTNPNLDRVNELIKKSIKEGGLHRLSNKEVDELFLKSLDSTSYVGHIPPLILAELTSRRSKISNYIAMIVSLTALIVAIYSVTQSNRDGEERAQWKTEQLESLKTINKTLSQIENKMPNPQTKKLHRVKDH